MSMMFITIAVDRRFRAAVGARGAASSVFGFSSAHSNGRLKTQKDVMMRAHRRGKRAPTTERVEGYSARRWVCVFFLEGGLCLFYFCFSF
jgi:hypothetical protein